MREFVLFTDSSCDLPADLADQLGLAVVPLSVTVGEDTYKNYLDGREIGFQDFYARLRRAESLPTTSQVNPEDFAARFRACRTACRDFLSLVAVTVQLLMR